MAKKIKVTMTKTLQLLVGRQRVRYDGGKTYDVDAETFKTIQAEKAGVEAQEGVKVAPEPKKSLPVPDGGKLGVDSEEEKDGDEEPFEPPNDDDTGDDSEDEEESDEESEESDDEEETEEKPVRKPRKRRRK